MESVMLNLSRCAPQRPRDWASSTGAASLSLASLPLPCMILRHLSRSI
jgi:hypothetical protein